MKELSLKKIEGMLDESYKLSFINPEDKIDINLIDQCLESRNPEAILDEIYRIKEDQEWYSMNDIMLDIEYRLIDRGYDAKVVREFIEEYQDLIRDLIYQRDNSDTLDDLVRNIGKIPIRLELLSNYDCINSHWLESDCGYSYVNSYFGDVVDALKLNPKTVKALFNVFNIPSQGAYPNRHSRNGKEMAYYKSFYDEIINSTCGANLFVIVAMVDMKDLVSCGFNLSKIIVPKGNKCGLFSSMQGGGSLMEMELRNDMEIDLTRKKYPYFRLVLDDPTVCCAYSIQETYGIDKKMFGEKIIIEV